MKKYVWLNLNNGEFSNSWDEETHKTLFPSIKDLLDKEHSAFNGWKLIEYTCINDENFDLYNKMKIVTNYQIKSN